jgi:hypothetical protein
MQSTLPTGRLRAQDQSGATHEIGSAHPDFQRLKAQYQQSSKRNSSPARFIGLLMIAIGIGGWWYNWHLAATEGHFYIKLCLLGPLGLAGGILMLVRPEWAGPLQSDSTRAHKAALFAAIGFMAVASGIDMYLLKYSRPARPSFTAWSPSLGTPSISGAPEMTFLDRTYRLGSFNQKQNATWEFVTRDETIGDWKTLLTIIDRPDARTREELDRLAEGIMAAYKSHGARILAAKTMHEDSGAAFNYMVAAFEEPGKQRLEVNFVKMALGPKNAAVLIYGVRITDPQDYRTKAKEFLDRNSGEIGRALGAAVLPDIGKLPRKAF